MAELIPFQSISNNTDYRDSCASTDGEDESELFHPEAAPSDTIDDDSESEFNRILDVCRKHREFAASKVDTNASTLRKPFHSKRVFDSEYDSLPAIEHLNISLKEETEFKSFGIVDAHVNYLVKIKPNKESPHLGYETILFDRDRNPIGEIFEIFGTVTDTSYALRFNNEEEAKSKLSIGDEVYYAVANNDVTKPIFTQELAKLKTWDRVRRNAGDSSSSEEVFSDDEKEKQYLAQKRQKKKNKHTQNISNDEIAVIPNSRAKYSAMKKPRREQNPFRFNYPHQQPRWQASNYGYFDMPAWQKLPPPPPMAFGQAMATSSPPVFGQAMTTSSPPVFGQALVTSSPPVFGHTMLTTSPPVFGPSMAVVNHQQGFVPWPSSYAYLTVPPPPPPPPPSNWLNFTPNSSHQFFNNQSYIPQTPYIISKAAERQNLEAEGQKK